MGSSPQLVLYWETWPPHPTIPQIVSLALNPKRLLYLIFLTIFLGSGGDGSHLGKYYLHTEDSHIHLFLGLSPELKLVCLTALKLPQTQHIQMSSLSSSEYKHAFVPVDRSIQPIAQDINLVVSTGSSPSFFSLYPINYSFLFYSAVSFAYNWPHFLLLTTKDSMICFLEYCHIFLNGICSFIFWDRLQLIHFCRPTDP